MRNHYIQKAFIDNFCGGNGILIYNILADKFLPKLNTANNIAMEKNLYHFKHIDYPDEQIEKDLKKIEDCGIAVIKEIINTEKLPSQKNLYALISYLYYQSKRTPFQRNELREETRKLNKICNTSDFDDWFVYDIYNKNAREIISTLAQEYNLFLLKYKRSNFFITDCFCAALSSITEQVIPLTSSLALYAVPINCKPHIHLELKKDIVNIISDNDFIAIMPLFAVPYKQFAFTSYTNDNVRLLPKLYKLLKSFY